MAEKLSDTAIRLATYLLKVRSKIEASDEYSTNNRFALALCVVCSTIQAAIMHGKLLEFVDHCLAFAAQQTDQESPDRLAFRASRDPSDN